MILEFSVDEERNLNERVHNIVTYKIDIHIIIDLIILIISTAVIPYYYYDEISIFV